MLEHILAKGLSGGDSQILMGSAGWDDEDEYVFLGTDENDGYTLVRVQLFEGRDFTQPKKARAQGHKIICHISSSGGMRIPPKDSRVFVAVPRGMDNVPGAGVIIATVEKSTASGQLQKDRTVLDFGPDTHVVIRGKSVAIQSSENEFISVGTPRSGGKSGVTVQAKDGSGAVFQAGVASMFVASGGEAKTIIQMTPTEIAGMCKGGGYWKVDASGFTCLGSNAYITCGAIYLGKSPTVANTVLWGPTGVAAAPSTCVYVSPA